MKGLYSGEHVHRLPPLADVLREIARDSAVRAWTRACSLQMLARLGLPECVPAIVETLDDPDEMVREIAYWALFKLVPSTFHLESRRRGKDRSLRVARFVRDLDPSGETTLERYS